MYVSAWQKFDCPVYRATALSDETPHLSKISKDSSTRSPVDKVAKIGGSSVCIREDEKNVSSVHSVDNVDDDMLMEGTKSRKNTLNEHDYESIKDIPIDPLTNI